MVFQLDQNQINQNLIKKKLFPKIFKLSDLELLTYLKLKMLKPEILFKDVPFVKGTALRVFNRVNI